MRNVELLQECFPETLEHKNSKNESRSTVRDTAGTKKKSRGLVVVVVVVVVYSSSIVVVVVYNILKVVSILT